MRNSNSIQLIQIKALIVVLLVAASGCSILPYEDEFSCRKTDDYGKCISVEEAYEEAVTGISKSPTLIPVSEQSNDAEERHRHDAKRSSETQGKASAAEPSAHVPIAPSPINPATAYTNYKASVYNELTTLIDAPRTPMLKPVTTIRTLILSYSENNNNKVIYMPRYVYSIVDEPRWVLTERLNRPVEDKFLKVTP